MFEHFMGLALKELTPLSYVSEFAIILKNAMERRVTIRKHMALTNDVEKTYSPSIAEWKNGLMIYGKNTF